MAQISYAVISIFRIKQVVPTYIPTVQTCTNLYSKCSKYDCMLGNRLSLSDPNSADNNQWKGDNLIGECMQEIKSKLSKDQCLTLNSAVLVLTVR